MIERVIQRLQREGLKLFTAESCTGGWIAKEFTEFPGVSSCFWGGVVVYDNQAKENLLGVPQKTLNQFGAVSEEVLNEMLLGALERYPVDIAVAVTGIAGPDGGSPEKPVGTVWIGIARRNAEVIKVKEVFKGDRKQVRFSAVEKVISLLGEAFNINRT